MTAETTTTMGERSSRTKEQARVATVAAFLAVFLSLLTLALTLMGYGYVFGKLESLGLHPEQLAMTPTDFLLRSYMPLVHAGSVLTSTFEEFPYLIIHQDIGWVMGLVTAVAALGCAVYAYLASHPSVRSWCFRRWQDLLYCKWVHRATTATANGLTRWRLLGWLGWVTVPGVMIFVSSVVGVLTIALWLIVVWWPLQWAHFGKLDADLYLLNAAECNSVAPCVRIVENGREIARGRLIDIVGKRAYLYPFLEITQPSLGNNKSPSNKRSINVPLDRALIESIDVSNDPIGE